MKNESSIEVKEGYLLVIARGTRKDFGDIIEGTLKISEAAKAYNVKFVLADYCEVNYEVPLADAFNLIKIYEKKVPVFNNLVISGVINKSNWELADFWQSIAKRRGFNYKAFTSFEKATKWLLQKIEEEANPANA